MSTLAFAMPFRPRGPADGLFGRWFRLFAGTEFRTRVREKKKTTVPVEMPSWLTRPSVKERTLRQLDDDIAFEVERFAPKSQRRHATEEYVNHFKSFDGEQPLDALAQIIMNLKYRDMMKFGEELVKKNGSPPNGAAAKTAQEAAAMLHSWAEQRVQTMFEAPIVERAK